MKRFKESILTKTLDELDNVFGDFYQSLSIEDREFVKGLISHFPLKIQTILVDRYKEIGKPFASNTYIRVTAKKLNELLPSNLIPHFDAGEHELREVAEKYALLCRQLSKENLPPREFRYITGTQPVNGNEALYEAYSKFVNGFGINEPEVSKAVTLTGAVKRMQDKYWWLRKLRKVVTRKREEVLIHLGQVNSRKGKYCSDLTVSYRLWQKELQREMLESLIIINEQDESFSLAEISDKNVSNPVNRKNELMTRIYGFEKLSKEIGHDAKFVTITCPSKYHNTFASSGDQNPKWDGSTPHDGQQYLNTTWQRIRAEFNRLGIQPYGFRVAEPQHDGTPHWHMLLFLESEQVDDFKRVIIEYSLQEDGDEAGAVENRCDFKDIDYSRGSATGYIAKYVSKGINGQNLDADLDGGSAPEAAQRIEAWASCWGIRQFQQIGAGSVTVWRELRRLKKLLGLTDNFKSIHAAADSGDWKEFVLLMGGVFCKRDEQTIRPLYQPKLDKESGELKQCWFDGTITTSLKGVRYMGQEIITREHEWRIEHSSERAA